MRMGQAGIRRGDSQLFELVASVNRPAKSATATVIAANFVKCERQAANMKGEEKNRLRSMQWRVRLAKLCDSARLEIRSLCRTTQVIRGPNAEMRDGPFERGERAASGRVVSVQDSGYRVRVAG